MRTMLLLSVLTVLAACKKEAAPENLLNDMPSPTAQPMVSGRFQNGPYGMVTGLGQVWKTAANTYEVVLDSFQTNNGPDLYVYLSKEIMPVNFIEAGKLKSTNGRQVYALASIPDLTQYKYVTIHCKTYNHLFGYAQLQ
jgi:hypothetical protein